MPAVTQSIPNFLGGVSRQNDDKKLLGQVTECVNGYPDPTYGLLKRPGMKFTNTLQKADGTNFTETELNGAVWFFMERDAAGSYIGAIKDNNIYVWTALDGTWCTVTNSADAYLTGTTKNDYHFRSIQDTTIITNKTVTAAMQPNGTFTPKTVATLKLVTLVETYLYTVTIQDIETTVTAQNSTTFDDMLIYDAADVDTNHHLIDSIKETIEAQHTASNADFDGIWYLEGYPDSIVIKRGTGTNAVVTDYSAVAGTPVAFEIDARGGLNNASIEAFEDEVANAAKLPVESFGGHHVTVSNTTNSEDDYHVEFVAYDTTLNRGRGYWEETIARDVSPGLDAATMPHELVNTGATTFTFDTITWSAREAGNDDTSPLPSFIGESITSTFFYSNRFGLLSQDNIFFGVANDNYNFFVKSALTQIDADPIDLNVSSIRPVTLSDVLPSPQGLMLFSARQQFQVLATDSSTLTPTTTVIRTLSNYEMETTISPVDVGVTAAFVNRVPGYSKLFSLQLRDVEQNPIVVDISKVVLEWLPDTIDDLSVSPQNSAILLIDTNTSYLYLYRFYNNGEKDLFQAWTKWKLPGTIQSAKIINDSVIIISQHEDEYTIGKIILDEIPSGHSVVGDTTINGNTCLDMATRPVSPTGIPSTLDTIVGGTGYSDATNVATTGGTGTGLTVDTTTSGGVVTAVAINTAGTGYTTGDVVTISGGGDNATVTVDTLTIAKVVYDNTNNITKIYTPYTPIQQKEAIMLLSIPEADEGTDAVVDADAGLYLAAIERTEINTGHRYFEVKGDYTDYADGIVVGYGYDFEVTMPKFYYKKDATTADYTATLTISRVTFSIGRTGPVLFKVKAGGSTEWENVEYVTDAGTYLADSGPVTQEHQFTIPIHQRNTNFELKVTSSFPYPVSLVSMTWEGIYSPRFYRRK